MLAEKSVASEASGNYADQMLATFQALMEVIVAQAQHHASIAQKKVI